MRDTTWVQINASKQNNYFISNKDFYKYTVYSFIRDPLCIKNYPELYHKEQHNNFSSCINRMFKY